MPATNSRAFSGFSFRPEDRIIDSAAHADAGSHSQNQSDDRVSHVDGGDADIADAVAHKIAVHDGVDAGQGEGQNRRDNKGKKCMIIGPGGRIAAGCGGRRLSFVVVFQSS